MEENSGISRAEICKVYPMDAEKLYVYDTLPSTNTTLREMAKEGAKEGTVLIASSQTGGRGRMGRRFFSPGESGIYMSVLFCPHLKGTDALSVTTMAAVAVAEAIEAVIGESVQIKWVNDIYYQTKKVCGILAEGAAISGEETHDYIVLGIGINVTMPEGGFPSEIAEIAGALFRGEPRCSRERLIGEILKRIFSYYENLAEKSFLEGYRARDFLTGKTVQIVRGTENFFATVCGIHDDFSLDIRLANGERQALSSGEVSICF